MYLALLASLASASVAAAAVGTLWAQEARREREEDLLRIGSLYAHAIASYYERSLSEPKVYPRTLDDLVLDQRFVGTIRHLRQLYPDPVGEGRPWTVIRGPDGGIRGVQSTSQLVPLRQVPVEIGRVRLQPAARYADWAFVATPRTSRLGNSARSPASASSHTLRPAHAEASAAGAATCSSGSNGPPGNSGGIAVLRSQATGGRDAYVLARCRLADPARWGPFPSVVRTTS